MRPVRVLGLVPYPLGRAPGQRYRIEQWAPILREHGVEVRFSPFLSARGMDVLYRRGHWTAKAVATSWAFLRRLREISRNEQHDAAFVFREATLLGPAWFERLVTRGLPVVLDFDDAIFLRPASAENAWVATFRSPGKVAALCRGAEHVTVGNDFLAAYARRFAHTVTVVPTTIDTESYRPRERAPNARPVIGWTGSATTVRYLAGLGPALRQLRQRIEFELRVVGGTLEIPGVDVRCVAWRAETEVDDLVPFDVGLMPLVDDEWAKGKCAAKALQYMALAIPPVVSPVGANLSVVVDGINGFHARTDEVWVDRILRLLRDPGLRAQLGREARRTVELGYSARAQAPRVAEILKGVAARQRKEIR